MGLCPTVPCPTGLCPSVHVPQFGNHRYKPTFLWHGTVHECQTDPYYQLEPIGTVQQWYRLWYRYRYRQWYRYSDTVFLIENKIIVVLPLKCWWTKLLQAHQNQQPNCNVHVPTSWKHIINVALSVKAAEGKNCCGKMLLQFLSTFLSHPGYYAQSSFSMAQRVQWLEALTSDYLKCAIMLIPAPPFPFSSG